MLKRWMALLLTCALLAAWIPWCAAEAVPMEASGKRRYSVLVMDVSGESTFSYNGDPVYTADSAVEYVKEAALAFMRDIIEAPGENYVALVTFDAYAQVVSGFTDDLDGLASTIGGISQSGDRTRSIENGLLEAEGLLEGLDDPNATLNVVLVTTGMTNAGDYDYSGFYDDDTVGNGWYNTTTGVYLYAYANKAYEAAARLKEYATVYVLGLFQTMEDMPEIGEDIALFFRITARDLASSAEDSVNVTDPSEIAFAFGSIADDIIGANPLIHGLYKYRGNYNEDDKLDTRADYYYTDDYFFRDSATLDWSLASMSLALELSSWASFEQENWYNPSARTAMNDRLVNAKMLLLGERGNETPDVRWDDAPDAERENWGYRGLGFTNFQANDYWSRDPEYDSVGVCAAARHITKGERDYTLVAVAVRGGGYGSEWASNFTLGTSGEHKGFGEARDIVLDWLGNTYLPSLDAEARSRPLKLWIVGYSRAGITANMVAGRIDEQAGVGGFSVAPEDLYCYTFEAPRGIVEQRTGGVFRNIHNIRNATDLVPMVAPRVWGFTRYNDTDSEGILPNPFIREPEKYHRYSLAFEEERKKLGFDVYPVKPDTAYEFQYFKVDKSKFLPGGDPLWWFDPYTIRTDVVVQQGVDYLFRDFIRDRVLYCNRMETTVRNLTGILMHYDGPMAGLMAAVGNAVTVKFNAKQLLKCVKEMFTWDNLSYVLSPMLSLNPFYTYDERVEDVKANARDVVSRCFAEYSVIMSAVQFQSFIQTIGDLFTEACLDMAKDLWNNDTRNINTLAELITVMVNGGIEAHYADVTLPWVRSLDPNFNPGVDPVDDGATTRVIRINCPVDVEVYDVNGDLRASFLNGEAVEGALDVPHAVDAEGEMVVYLPGDSGYHLELTGREAGQVNVSLSEYNYAQEATTRLENYYDIPVAQGDVIFCEIPALTLEDRQANSAEGSSAAYDVSVNGESVPAGDALRGAAADEARHTVEIEVEGTGGYADGAGTFLQGSFAQVEAFALPNAEFAGWFDEGGRLLSAENIYRFAVRQDTKLIARFSDVNFYALKVTAQEGGTVAEVDDWYCPGIEMQLRATPDAGWRFAGWQLEGPGSVSDPNDPDAVYTMGSGEARLTARFASDSAPVVTPPPVSPGGSSAAARAVDTLLLVLLVLALAAGIPVVIVLTNRKNKK